MNTVWKYPFDIADKFELLMPDGAEVLLVDSQGPLNPCVWARVDTDAPRVKRRFELRGTGHDCSGVGKHLGSLQLRGGSLVFHLFEGQ